MAIPLYLFAGLLDSGKTTVLKETLADEVFHDGLETLIIALEDGEVQYDNKFLKAVKAKLLRLEDLTHLTKKLQYNILHKYHFSRIFLETNGLEDEYSFIKNGGLLQEIELAEALCIADASQFRLQITNLRTFFYNHIKGAEVCIFNRFDREDDYLYIRNNLKALNPGLKLVFENSKGAIVQVKNKELFDLSKGYLVIKDTDFGLWYMDFADNPLKYAKIKITLNLELLADYPTLAHSLFLGRQAMVCCADDLARIGLRVDGVDKKQFQARQFYEVCGTLLPMVLQAKKTCILAAESVKEIKRPLDSYVYFN